MAAWDGAVWDEHYRGLDDPDWDRAAAERALAMAQGNRRQQQRGTSLQECEAAVGEARGHVTGRKAAHTFLSTWRARNQGGPPDVCTDLLDGREFNWKCYLGQHRDRNMIFDGGALTVIGFGIRRVPWIFDTNTSDGRVDFVVARSDDSAMRLHPGNKDEALAVIHTERPSTAQRSEERWHEDGVPPTLAAPQGKGHNKGLDPADVGGAGKGDGKGDAQRHRKHYRGASAADLIPTAYVSQ